MPAFPADVPRLGPEFFENRRNFPPDVLYQYAGNYVAWSWDGTQIVAAAEDDEELEQKLIAAGLDPSRVVVGWVDPM